MLTVWPFHGGECRREVQVISWYLGNEWINQEPMNFAAFGISMDFLNDPCISSFICNPVQS
jgi:hypothetical protein